MSYNKCHHRINFFATFCNFLQFSVNFLSNLLKSGVNGQKQRQDCRQCALCSSCGTLSVERSRVLYRAFCVQNGVKEKGRYETCLVSLMRYNSHYAYQANLNICVRYILVLPLSLSLVFVQCINRAYLVLSMP